MLVLIHGSKGDVYINPDQVMFLGKGLNCTVVAFRLAIVQPTPHGPAGGPMTMDIPGVKVQDVAAAIAGTPCPPYVEKEVTTDPPELRNGTRRTKGGLHLE